MSIHKIATNILNTNWTLTDDFSFSFSQGNSTLVTNGPETVQDIWDKSVISIDLPQISADVSTVMQGGEWRIYNSKFNPFTFSITLRDFEGLSLRRFFVNAWTKAQRGYFDDVKSTVEISIDGVCVFKSEHCLISAVSQVQLSNNDTQIAEFTVEFSSPYFSDSKIAMFGTDSYDG